MDDDGTNNKLQRYRELIVQDIHTFMKDFLHSDDNEELERLTKGIHMDGIFSLNMSSSLPTFSYFHSLHCVLAYILPNVREIDLYNNRTIPVRVLEKFTEKCRHLEKVKWNNSTNYCIYASGDSMRSSDNLKEIDFDNLSFCFFIADDFNDEREKNDRLEQSS